MSLVRPSSAPSLRAPALVLALTAAGPAAAFDAAVSVHPQFVGDGALTEYMQIASLATTSGPLTAGQEVLFPIAGENLAGELYNEICISLTAAGPAGSTITVPLYELQDATSSLRPYEKVWEGVFANDVAGQQCLSFGQGTIIDPLGNAHFTAWETSPGVFEDVLVLLYGEVLWKGVVKSAGTNAMAMVNANAVRSLGGSPTVTGTPPRGFRLTTVGFPAVLDPADLLNYTGAVPFVGLRRVPE